MSNNDFSDIVSGAFGDEISEYAAAVDEMDSRLYVDFDAELTAREILTPYAIYHLKNEFSARLALALINPDSISDPLSCLGEARGAILDVNHIHSTIFSLSDNVLVRDEIANIFMEEHFSEVIKEAIDILKETKDRKITPGATALKTLASLKAQAQPNSIIKFISL